MHLNFESLTEPAKRVAYDLSSRGAQAHLDDLGGGVLRIAMSTPYTRLLKMPSSAYLVGDVLIDSGFRWVREAVMRALAGRRLRVVIVTHHHEDHVGNCGPIADLAGAEVLMYRPEHRFGEGVMDMEPYRRITWGSSTDYLPKPLGDTVEAQLSGRARPLRVVPTPGHSATHVCFVDDETGTVFSGDLYIAAGAAAVMPHEDPYQHVASLRAIAALDPERMLSGHGHDLARPAAKLTTKAERIEEVIERVRALHGQGLGEAEIESRVFRHGKGREKVWSRITAHEFSRQNLIRGVIRGL